MPENNRSAFSSRQCLFQPIENLRLPVQIRGKQHVKERLREDQDKRSRPTIAHKYNRKLCGKKLVSIREFQKHVVARERKLETESAQTRMNVALTELLELSTNCESRATACFDEIQQQSSTLHPSSNPMINT